MSIYEYDEEKTMRQMRAEGYELGEKRGLEQGLEQGIEQGIGQGIEQGLEQGIKQGIQQGIQALLEFSREMGESRDAAKTRIIEKFSLDPVKAEEYMREYWK